MLQVLRGFQANQGLLLAGAVACCALLSIVPLPMLTLIALSHFVHQVELLQTVRRQHGDRQQSVRNRAGKPTLGVKAPACPGPTATARTSSDLRCTAAPVHA